MKRKVVSLLLALALSVSVTACTNVGEGSSSPESTQESSAESSKEQEGTDAGQETKESQGSEIPPTDPDEMKEAGVLQNGFYSDKYFVIDKYGNKVSEYDWGAVVKKLKDKGWDFSDVGTCNLGDGFFYFYHFENFDNVRWGYRVYAVDATTLEVTPLWSSPENGWLSNIDYYQGKVHLLVSGGDNIYQELIYTREGSQFREEKSEYNDLIKELKDYYFTLYAPSLGMSYGKCTLSRAFDENGYVIGSKDNKYYKITKDGTLSVLSAISDNTYVRAYDANGIVYGDSDYMTGKSEYMFLDLSSNLKQSIYQGEDSFTFLAYADGKVYYGLQPANDFGLVKNITCQFDVNTGETKILYEETAVAGATDVAPGTQDFQVVDGKLYYVKLVDDKLTWVRFDPDANGNNIKNLGLVVGEKSVFRYGKVISDSYINYCKNCGIAMEKNYQEEFELDAKYSDKANVINEKLHDGLKWVRDVQEVKGSDENCEDHRAYPVAYCQTIENQITGVKILSDKYLTIDYSSYWYGGGAHGMPGMDQRIFDLETGEEMTFDNLYTGSMEDFKKLVAQKTKEDFLSYDEGSTPYFAESADEVYKQAYKQVDSKICLILFDEKGITVAYMPYEMGPYASGFIEISLTYEEVFGRSSL